MQKVAMRLKSARLAIIAVLGLILFSVQANTPYVAKAETVKETWLQQYDSYLKAFEAARQDKASYADVAAIGKKLLDPSQKKYAKEAKWGTALIKQVLILSELPDTEETEAAFNRVGKEFSIGAGGANWLQGKPLFYKVEFLRWIDANNGIIPNPNEFGSYFSQPDIKDKDPTGAALFYFMASIEEDNPEIRFHRLSEAMIAASKARCGGEFQATISLLLALTAQEVEAKPEEERVARLQLNILHRAENLPNVHPLTAWQIQNQLLAVLNRGAKKKYWPEQEALEVAEKLIGREIPAEVSIKELASLFEKASEVYARVGEQAVADGFSRLVGEIAEVEELRYGTVTSIHVQIAGIYRPSMKFDKVEEQIELALRAARTSGHPALLALALNSQFEQLWTFHRYEEAKSVLEEVEKLGEHHPEIMEIAASERYGLASALHDFKESTKYWDALSPETQKALAPLRVQEILYNGDYEGAQALAKKFDQDPTDLLFYMTGLLAAGQEYETALSFAQELEGGSYSLSPVNRYKIVLLKEFLLWQLGRGKEAYAASIEVEKKSKAFFDSIDMAGFGPQASMAFSFRPELYYRRGEYLASEGKWPEAFAKFQTAHGMIVRQMQPALSSPAGASALKWEPVPFKDAQAKLSNRRLIIYAVLTEKILAFCLTKDGAKIVNLGSQDGLSNLIDQIPDSPQARKKLYDRLLKPCFDDEESELIIVADGIIERIPFLALLALKEDGQGKLPAVYYLSNCHDLLAQASTPKSRSTLVMGGPDFGLGNANDKVIASRSRGSAKRNGGSAWPPLPAARTEAISVARLLGTPAFVGKEATKAQFLKDAPKARILHLATHGFVSPTPRGVMGVLLDDPNKNAGLVFAGANSDPLNGELTALEILQLDLSKVELVCLSACESGLGDMVPGEGLIGLRHAFEVAGARQMLVSLWPVDDEATQALMVGFYSGLKEGLAPSAALRRIQQQMKDEGALIVDWASFILVGPD